MKKYNTTTNEFEDYTEDTKKDSLREQLLKDKVPFSETFEGIFVKDEDFEQADIVKKKLKFK